MNSAGAVGESAFDRRLSSLCGSIDDLELRVHTAESKAEHYQARCVAWARGSGVGGGACWRHM